MEVGWWRNEHGSGHKNMQQINAGGAGLPVCLRLDSTCAASEGISAACKSVSFHNLQTKKLPSNATQKTAQKIKTNRRQASFGIVIALKAGWLGCSTRRRNSSRLLHIASASSCRPRSRYMTARVCMELPICGWLGGRTRRQNSIALSAITSASSCRPRAPYVAARLLMEVPICGWLGGRTRR